jgi:hypothetical protein
MLFLPNGSSLFQLVDDIAAGREGVVPMRSRDRHRHRWLAHGDISDAMLDRKMD